MSAAEEKAYIAGRQLMARSLLGMALGELYVDGIPDEQALRVERADAIITLRRLCAEEGDNDWEDNLHLSDIIEKHLVRAMGANTAQLCRCMERLLKMLPIGFAPTGRPGGADERNAELDRTRNEAIDLLERIRGES